MLLIFSVFFILAVREIDRSFPVIKDFKVTSQAVGDNTVIIEGTLNKVRDCKILSVNAFTPEGRKLDIEFPPGISEDNLPTRPVRIQFWGPWEVHNNGVETITIYAQHACSIFWTQTTKLTDLTLIKVPVIITVPENEKISSKQLLKDLNEAK